MSPQELTGFTAFARALQVEARYGTEIFIHAAAVVFKSMTPERQQEWLENGAELLAREATGAGGDASHGAVH